MTDVISTERAGPCPICGAVAREAVHEGLTDILFGTTGVWTLAQCVCGLVSLDPRPTAADIGKAYASYYTHHASAADGVSALGRLHLLIQRCYLSLKYGYPEKPLRRWLGLLEYLDPFRREVLEFSVMYLPYAPGSKLLEIGSGDGGFLARMRAYGWDAEAVDIDAEAAATAARASGARVHVGTLEAQRFPDRHFDVVTLSHVIEHLHDPVAVLREIRRILRPGGRVVIVTPNWSSWGHRLFGAKWPGNDPPRHLHLFTPQTMARALECAGFRILRIRTTVRGSEFMWTWRNGNPRVRRDHGHMVASSEQRRWAGLFARLQWIRMRVRPNDGDELLAIASVEG